MLHQSYDLIVCAGISSVKWLSNKEPEKDRADIESLENVLKTIHAKKFILISTIDVYPLAVGENEDYSCDKMSNHPYGTHRLAFENFCIEKFSDLNIIRLPGLFGDGLKKNVIYDLLNDNCLEMINTDSSFQYYDLNCLWKDIQKAVENDIRKINLFTEPIETRSLLKAFFPSKIVGQKPVSEKHYDLHTKYSSYWSKEGPYIYTKSEVMEQISEFINKYKRPILS